MFGQNVGYKPVYGQISEAFIPVKLMSFRTRTFLTESITSENK